MSGVNQTARIYRLCLKELRESLRDRRTIITLVLMPLLVYPLLSMILQRLLISTTTAADEEANVVKIGVNDESLKASLIEAIARGKYLLANRGSETLSILRGDAPPTLLTGAKASQQSAVQQILAQKIVLYLLSPDDGNALLSGQIDVLITGNASGKYQSLNDAHDAAMQSEDPSAANPAAPRRRRSDIIREIVSSMPNDNYTIDYVANDRHSEWALHMLRSLFSAINEETSAALVQIAGAEYRPPITMSAAPIKMPDSTSTLASLVPLVLVLMTIAGAVYPAIDLTAGERERGTLEAVIVSPTSRSVLLLAKYVAVVTVALLTAIANLTAMSITLWASGLGRLVFGGNGLTLLTTFQILCLLVLFAMFFSAILLSITSFAKSFKEAQAYLIPVMLVSLAPGVLSLLPEVRLTNWLAAVPLANIVLLSRDVLVGAAGREAGVIAIVCTVVYAIAAIAVASRLFGSDASLQGSQGSWKDFFRRPELRAAEPTVDQMALTMACLFPLYFVASTTLPMLGDTLASRLQIASLISWLLIFGLPTLVSRYQRHDFRAVYLTESISMSRWLILLPAILLLAGSLWMLSHELMIVSQQLGLATFTEEQLKKTESLAEQMQTLPLSLLLFAGAITPAICEEWFFRGFVMASLRRFGMWNAVLGSAFLFALMHVLTSNALSLERLLPSFQMGIALGLIAWRTGSLWPGVLLHACHNGFMLSLIHFKAEISELGIGVEERAHLPITWLAGGVLACVIGALLLSIRAASKPPMQVEGDLTEGR